MKFKHEKFGIISLAIFNGKNTEEIKQIIPEKIKEFQVEYPLIGEKALGIYIKRENKHDIYIKTNEIIIKYNNTADTYSWSHIHLISPFLNWKEPMLSIQSYLFYKKYIKNGKSWAKNRKKAKHLGERE